MASHTAIMSATDRRRVASSVQENSTSYINDCHWILLLSGWILTLILLIRVSYRLMQLAVVLAGVISALLAALSQVVLAYVAKRFGRSSKILQYYYDSYEDDNIHDHTTNSMVYFDDLV